MSNYKLLEQKIKQEKFSKVELQQIIDKVKEIISRRPKRATGCWKRTDEHYISESKKSIKPFGVFRIKYDVSKDGMTGVSIACECFPVLNKQCISTSFYSALEITENYFNDIDKITKLFINQNETRRDYVIHRA